VSVRILSYNIRFGGAEREKQIAAVIKACEPDVVILQEAVRPDVVNRLSSVCAMPRWGAVAGHSLAYLSRVEIKHHAWHKARFAKRRYLEIVLAATDIRIYGVHLSAIHSNLTEWRRTYELGALLNGIRKHQKGFHMVTGDFNTLAPGEKFDVSKLPARLRAIVWMTGGKIRWTTIQRMLDGGYTDGYRIFHKSDSGFTFPTWDPHVRLDYAFLPQESAARLKSCEVKTDAPMARDASDHFPLLSVLE
jgi:endonuclease/exonuclease/phosphatase family metal-dependent hydrolase